MSKNKYKIQAPNFVGERFGGLNRIDLWKGFAEFDPVVVNGTSYKCEKKSIDTGGESFDLISTDEKGKVVKYRIANVAGDGDEVAFLAQEVKTENEFASLNEFSLSLIKAAADRYKEMSKTSKFEAEEATNLERKMTECLAEVDTAKEFVFSGPETVEYKLSKVTEEEDVWLIKKSDVAVFKLTKHDSYISVSINDENQASAKAYWQVKALIANLKTRKERFDAKVAEMKENQVLLIGGNSAERDAFIKKGTDLYQFKYQGGKPVGKPTRIEDAGIAEAFNILEGAGAGETQTLSEKEAVTSFMDFLEEKWNNKGSAVIRSEERSGLTTYSRYSYGGNKYYKGLDGNVYKIPQSGAEVKLGVFEIVQASATIVDEIDPKKKAAYDLAQSKKAAGMFGVVAMTIPAGFEDKLGAEKLWNSASWGIETAKIDDKKYQIKKEGNTSNYLIYDVTDTEGTLKKPTPLFRVTKDVTDDKITSIHKVAEYTGRGVVNVSVTGNDQDNLGKIFAGFAVAQEKISFDVTEGEAQIVKFAELIKGPATEAEFKGGDGKDYKISKADDVWTIFEKSPPTTTVSKFELKKSAEDSSISVSVPNANAAGETGGVTPEQFWVLRSILRQRDVKVAATEFVNYLEDQSQISESKVLKDRSLRAGGYTVYSFEGKKYYQGRDGLIYRAGEDNKYSAITTTEIEAEQKNLQNPSDKQQKLAELFAKNNFADNPKYRIFHDDRYYELSKDGDEIKISVLNSDLTIREVVGSLKKAGDVYSVETLNYQQATSILDQAATALTAEQVAKIDQIRGFVQRFDFSNSDIVRNSFEVGEAKYQCNKDTADFTIKRVYVVDGLEVLTNFARVEFKDGAYVLSKPQTADNSAWEVAVFDDVLSAVNVEFGKREALDQAAADLEDRNRDLRNIGAKLGGSLDADYPRVSFEINGQSYECKKDANGAISINKIASENGLLSVEGFATINAVDATTGNRTLALSGGAVSVDADLNGLKSVLDAGFAVNKIAQAEVDVVNARRAVVEKFDFRNPTNTKRSKFEIGDQAYECGMENDPSAHLIVRSVTTDDDGFVTVAPYAKIEVEGNSYKFLSHDGANWSADHNADVFNQLNQTFANAVAVRSASEVLADEKERKLNNVKVKMPDNLEIRVGNVAFVKIVDSATRATTLKTYKYQGDLIGADSDVDSSDKIDGAALNALTSAYVTHPTDKAGVAEKDAQALSSEFEKILKRSEYGDIVDFAEDATSRKYTVDSTTLSFDAAGVLESSVAGGGRATVFEVFAQRKAALELIELKALKNHDTAFEALENGGNGKLFSRAVPLVTPKWLTENLLQAAVRGDVKLKQGADSVTCKKGSDDNQYILSVGKNTYRATVAHDTAGDDIRVEKVVRKTIYSAVDDLFKIRDPYKAVSVEKSESESFGKINLTGADLVKILKESRAASQNVKILTEKLRIKIDPKLNSSKRAQAVLISRSFLGYEGNPVYGATPASVSAALEEEKKVLGRVGGTMSASALKDYAFEMVQKESTASTTDPHTKNTLGVFYELEIDGDSTCATKEVKEKKALEYYQAAAEAGSAAALDNVIRCYEKGIGVDAGEKVKKAEIGKALRILKAASEVEGNTHQVALDKATAKFTVTVGADNVEVNRDTDVNANTNLKTRLEEIEKSLGSQAKAAVATPAPAKAKSKSAIEAPNKGLDENLLMYFGDKTTASKKINYGGKDYSCIADGDKYVLISDDEKNKSLTEDAKGYRISFVEGAPQVEKVVRRGRRVLSSVHGAAYYTAVPAEATDKDDFAAIAAAGRAVLNPAIETERNLVIAKIGGVGATSVAGLTAAIEGKLKITDAGEKTKEAKRIVHDFLGLSKSGVNKATGEIYFYSDANEKYPQEIEDELKKFAQEKLTGLDATAISSPATTQELHAKYLAGKFYQLDVNGKTSVENQKSAFGAFKVASDAEYLPAKNEEALCHYYGRGVAKDKSLGIKKTFRLGEGNQAFKLLSEASVAGYLPATYNLGLFSKDVATAAQRGEAQAQLEVGKRQLSANPFVGDYFGQSFKYLTQAAEKGHAPAYRELGKLHESGAGQGVFVSGVFGKKNPEEAFKKYKLAVEAGETEALVDLARCYEKGIGTKLNQESAKILSAVHGLMESKAFVEVDGKNYQIAGFAKDRGFIFKGSEEEFYVPLAELEKVSTYYAKIKAKDKDNADKDLKGFGKTLYEAYQAEVLNEKDRRKQKGAVRTPENLDLGLLEYVNDKQVSRGAVVYKCERVQGQNEYRLYQIDHQGKEIKTRGQNYYQVAVGKSGKLEVKQLQHGVAQSGWKTKVDSDLEFAEIVSAFSDARRDNFKFELADVDAMEKKFEAGVPVAFKSGTIAFNEKVSGESGRYEITASESGVVKTYKISQITFDSEKGEVAHDVAQVAVSEVAAIAPATTPTKKIEIKIPDPKDPTTFIDCTDPQKLWQIRSIVTGQGIKDVAAPLQENEVKFNSEVRRMYSSMLSDVRVLTKVPFNGVAVDGFELDGKRYVKGGDKWFTVEKNNQLRGGLGISDRSYNQKKEVLQELGSAEKVSVAASLEERNGIFDERKQFIKVKNDLVKRVREKLGFSENFEREALKIVNTFLGLIPVKAGEFYPCHDSSTVKREVKDILTDFAIDQNVEAGLFTTTSSTAPSKKDSSVTAETLPASYLKVCSAVFCDNKVGDGTAFGNEDARKRHYCEVYKTNAAKNLIAANNYGRLFEFGLKDSAGADIVAEDKVEAFKQYKSAVTNGSFFVLENVTRCYKDGVGTAKDEKMADLLELMKWASNHKSLIDGQNIRQGKFFSSKYQVSLYDPQKGFVISDAKGAELARVKVDGLFKVDSQHQEVAFDGGANNPELKKITDALKRIKEGRVEQDASRFSDYDKAIEELAKNLANVLDESDEAAKKATAKKLAKKFILGFEEVGSVRKEILKNDLLASCSQDQRDVIAAFAKNNVENFSQSGSQHLQDLAGQIYFHGIGVEKDRRKAASCFAEAANVSFDDKGKLVIKDEGYAPAQYHLGVMYLNGGDTAFKDDSYAFKCFEKAAEQRFMPAIVSLVNCYAGGHGCDVDLVKAQEFYNKVPADYPAAAASDLVKSVNRTPTLSDDTQVAKKLQTLIDRDPECHEHLGGFYERGIETPDGKTNNGAADEQYRIGVEKGEPGSMRALAVLCREGRNGPADHSLALQLEKRAEVFDACREAIGLGYTVEIKKEEMTNVRGATESYKIAKDGDGFLISVDGVGKNGFRIFANGSAYEIKNGKVVGNFSIDNANSTNEKFSKILRTFERTNQDYNLVATTGLPFVFINKLTDSLTKAGVTRENAELITKDFLGISDSEKGFTVAENGRAKMTQYYCGNKFSESYLGKAEVKKVLEKFANEQVNALKDSSFPHQKHLVGTFYEMGLIGGKEDLAQAQIYFELAAQAHYVPAQAKCAEYSRTTNAEEALKKYDVLAQKRHMSSVEAIVDFALAATDPKIARYDTTTRAVTTFNAPTAEEKTGAEILKKLLDAAKVGCDKEVGVMINGRKQSYKISDYDPDRGIMISLIDDTNLNASKSGFRIASVTDRKGGFKVFQVAQDRSENAYDETKHLALKEIMTEIESQTTSKKKEQDQVGDVKKPSSRFSPSSVVSLMSSRNKSTTVSVP